MMDENKNNKDVEADSSRDHQLRPYRTPTLRTLGNAQSVVLAGASGPFDGGGNHDSSHGS